MKKISKTVAKGLLLLTLSTGISIALSTAGVKTINEAHAAATYEQVYTYLVYQGYSVVTLSPVITKKTDDWVAHTTLGGIHFMTTIHVTNSIIVGHDDIIM